MPSEKLIKYKALVKNKPLKQLIKWQMVLRKKHHDPNNKEDKLVVKKLIDYIQQEYGIRGDLPTDHPQYELMDLPDKGMPSVFGYHVGEIGGMEEGFRWGVLEAIIEGPLPTIASESYMSEFGEDGSKERFRKIRNILWAYRKRSNSNHVRAREEWSSDIDWLDEHKEELITKK